MCTHWTISSISKSHVSARIPTYFWEMVDFKNCHCYAKKWVIVHNIYIILTWKPLGAGKLEEIYQYLRTPVLCFVIFYCFYVFLQQLGTKYYFRCENSKSKYFVYAPTGSLTGENIVYIDWTLVIKYLSPSLNINF